VAGGVSVTVAEALFAGSAWLVAVTVTVCCVVMLEGAVYSPVVVPIEPTSGLIDHVTAVFVVPETAAVNCCVCDGPRLTVVGETDTLTTAGGTSVTVAEALFVESAWLVAVTVTVCCVVMLEGAVYNPDEVRIDPTSSLF
jgi:hypothetical protein